MKFESVPSEDIILNSYGNLLYLQEEESNHGSVRLLVNELLGEQKTAEHMMNVMYPAAELVERRKSSGEIIDPDRQASKALIIGGALASAIVYNAGGSQLLDRIVLKIPTAAKPEMTPTQIEQLNAQELWLIGDETYRDPRYHIFRALIEEWQDDLAAPPYQQCLHVGFGLILHYVEEEIIVDKLKMHDFRSAVRAIEDGPTFDWDADLRQLFEAGGAE